ncbi:MAG: hypothetical protein E6X43_12690, partial [Peptostreptococcaceae bacterium]|nr:hypothetical protein [Peptostreptococcaceae bacterium]
LYEDAKKMFDTTANENNTYSQHMVGVIYHTYYNDYVNAKFWYEKARNNGCVESIYNLGQLSFKLNSYAEAEKYYNEGIKLGNKKCEYMLAGLYYKKSLEIYENLSKEDYLNSTIITDKLPKLELNVDEVMIAEFNEEKIISDGEEEEYVPNYILDLNENIEDIFEGINKEMIIEK